MICCECMYIFIDDYAADEHTDNFCFLYIVTAFYRVMLCIRSTSHGPVSVCLSVCHKPVFY